MLAKKSRLHKTADNDGQPHFSLLLCTVSVYVLLLKVYMLRIYHWTIPHSKKLPFRALLQVAQQNPNTKVHEQSVVH